MATKKDRVYEIIATPVVRLSYANLIKPKAAKGSTDEKFSVNLIFEPADATELYKTIIKVAKEAFGENAEAMFASGGLHYPLQDGSKPNKKTLQIDPVTNGKYFVSAKAQKDKPPVTVGPRNEPIGPEAFYSGCYARAQISVYSFNAELNQGVSIGLNMLKFIRDGEKLGGGAPSAMDAEDIFGGDTDAPLAPATALPGFGMAVAPTPIAGGVLQPRA